MELLEHFNLKNFNTFRVSAFARYFANVTSLDELRRALELAREKGLPFMLIGQGSNLLFREDYPGLIIELNIKGIELLEQTPDYYLVNAKCGENWHAFVEYCLEHHYWGLENLSLIPGTVGAAPVQNIGAYGVEIAEFLHELRAMEVATGKLATFANADCGFSYRSSAFKHEFRDRYVICDVTFKLLREPKVNIGYWALQEAFNGVTERDITPLAVSRAVCAIRRAKLPDPLALGNAGSFFWNPMVEPARFAELRRAFPDMEGYPEQGKIKIPAAWLIEKAGWKGYRAGDVGVHNKHALVLVNHGKATGAELYDLAIRIRASVKAMFGIELNPEVRIV